jgi:hypothetical protein
MGLFKIDVHDVKEVRKIENYDKALDALYKRTPLVPEYKIKKLLNVEAVYRLLEKQNITYDELLDSLKEGDPYTTVVGLYTSIQASRQGKVTESFMLKNIAKSVKEYGITITNDSNIRFIKDGRVLDKKQFKKSGLDRNLDSHKLVDGLISGKITGYIMAKVVDGNGGHQDNVLHELVGYIEWINKYAEKGKLYVLLVDGKEYPELDVFKKDNLWIVDHYEFQLKLIERVSS